MIDFWVSNDALLRMCVKFLKEADKVRLQLLLLPCALPANHL